MSQTSVARQPATATRVRLSQEVITLDDGHKVGVTIGGKGVPLVFLHGIALSGRAYVRLLSRLAGMGFLVVALDAAGHGVTPNLPRNAADLSHRVDLTLRTLDALGIGKAVFMGHSMGGRMLVALAALAPERVLAAVLLNAAAGAPFDESIRTPVRSPRRAAKAVLNAAYDAPADPRRLPARERRRYMRQMAAALARNVRTPLGLPGAIQAIVTSGDYTPMLDAMRRHSVPTIVVHGENDLVVPFESAEDMAERADGTLYRVPGAYHSWMLANPRHGADMVRQLLAAELGDVLREAARALGIVGVPGGWQYALLTTDSPLHSLEDRPLEVVGVEPPEHVDMDRLRSACRAPNRRTARRLRWFDGWRRRREQTASAGTADIA
ncbi:alpha/beta fold hydrolase [Mycolicibacterium stellerae]|uniref:alpha/beta fold hydrolase n=1 Tax=Mycolicibacterium stellerae TaxID=2358193 RepID=UPI0013DE0AA8|nr:alpha/beta hydrolase [Mycolicibacterium stellerae]